jgi:hypothetical protein
VIGLSGKTKPKRVVVKEYGRDLVLLAALNPIPGLNPLMTALMPRLVEGRLESQTRAIERDATLMAKRGYRVVASQEYTPRPGIAYHKVTYELIGGEPARA